MFGGRGWEVVRAAAVAICMLVRRLAREIPVRTIGCNALTAAVYELGKT